MEGETRVTGSIIDEFHCSDIERDEIEREIGSTRSIFDEINFSDIQEHQMEGDSCVT